MSTYLRTARLTLRRLTADDLDNLVALDGDPAVMRYLTGGRPTPRAAMRSDLMDRLLPAYRRDPRFGRWAAEVGGVFAGWFALWVPDGADGRDVELGYRLRRAAWGAGLATEGCRALVHRALHGYRVDRVWAQTMAVNTASRRVMAKAGLAYVRTFHLDWDEPIDGAEHGEVEYERRAARSPRVAAGAPVGVPRRGATS